MRHRSRHSRPVGGSAASAVIPAYGTAHKAGEAGPSRLRFFLLLLLFAAAALAGALTRSRDIRTWWLNRQSLDSLKARVQSPGASTLARYIYARRLLDLGNTSGALTAFANAARLIPPDAKDPLAEPIEAHLGYLLARQGDYDAASPALTRACSLDNDDPLAHVGLGMVFASRKMLKYTETQFKLAAALDPKDVEAFYRWGAAENDADKPEQAIAPLKRAIALAPTDAASHHELGTAYALQDRFKTAIPEFKQAVAIDPSNRDYQVALGAAEAMDARSPAEYHAAARLLEKALSGTPSDPYPEYTLGLLYMRFNALPEAMRHLSHYVQLRPSDTKAYYDLALVEQRLGNDAAYRRIMAQFQHLTAIRSRADVLEKRVGAAPGDPALRIQLADAYRDTGNVVGVYWQLKIAQDLGLKRPGLASEVAAAHRRMKAAGPLHVEYLPGAPITPGPPLPEAFSGNPLQAAPASEDRAPTAPSPSTMDPPRTAAGP